LLLDSGAADAFDCRGEAVVLPSCAPYIWECCHRGSTLLRPAERDPRPGEYRMALVIALVSIVVIWLVVISGSIYLNKNVQ
jgi:hypothetical protein